MTSPKKAIRRRNGIGMLKQSMSFAPPEDDADETCFYIEFEPDSQGNVTACLFNPNLGEEGMGAYVRYRCDTLPVFIHWTILRSREYVCGLEPANCILDDRSEKDITLCRLAPLEKRRFSVEIGVVEGERSCQKLIGGE